VRWQPVLFVVPASFQDENGVVDIVKPVGGLFWEGALRLTLDRIQLHTFVTDSIVSGNCRFCESARFNRTGGPVRTGSHGFTP
jgi:hypothetical protein